MFSGFPPVLKGKGHLLEFFYAVPVPAQLQRNDAFLSFFEITPGQSTSKCRVFSLAYLQSPFFLGFCSIFISFKAILNRQAPRQF